MKAGIRAVGFGICKSARRSEALPFKGRVGMVLLHTNLESPILNSHSEGAH